jgi:hypothetical protein
MGYDLLRSRELILSGLKPVDHGHDYIKKSY